MDPLRAIGRETSGWDHAVDVRMMEQVLTPGMEDGKESDLGPQMFGIDGYLQKGLRTGAEQEVIEDLLVLQRQLGELVRQSEDNMNIGDRQKFVLTSGDPLIASPALTLGTMAIAAAIKGDGAIATARAFVAMPAAYRRTAAGMARSTLRWVQ
jgi:hypothetical protein